MPLRLRIFLAYAACCLLWGSTWLMIKLGLRDLPPLLFAGARMGLAAVLLTPFAWRHGARSLERPVLWRMAGLGLLQIGIPYAFMFVAQQWVASGLSAVLFATFPVWLALLAARLLPGHPLTPSKLLAAALGVGGIVVLQWPHLRALDLSRGAALGAGLIVAGSMVAALANVLIRRSMSEASALLLTWSQVLSGALFLLALAAVFERGAPVAWTPRALAVLVYLAVFGTVLTYLALFWLLPRIPVQAVGAIPLLDTTCAVLLGAIFLSEPLGARFVAGFALVLGSAGLANFAPESGMDKAGIDPIAGV